MVPNTPFENKVSRKPYENCKECGVKISIKEDPEAWPYLCAKHREGKGEKDKYDSK